MRPGELPVPPPGRSGPWSIETFTVTAEDAAFESIRALQSGRGVRAGQYTGLYRGGSVIMSDTPDELRDLVLLRTAAGAGLITGLGLGLALQLALRRAEVTRVTVIEKSPDVIALVAPSITDPRVEIIEADAFEWKPPRGARYGFVWHDVWDNITSDNLPEMHRLNRKFARYCTGWQGCWCRDQCERMRRRGR